MSVVIFMLWVIVISVVFEVLVILLSSVIMWVFVLTLSVFVGLLVRISCGLWMRVCVIVICCCFLLESWEGSVLSCVLRFICLSILVVMVCWC